MSYVVRGCHQGKKIKNNFSGGYLHIEPDKPWEENYMLTKRHLASYEVITEDTVKSGSSAILRGAVGVALLGGVGLLAGLSAKNKTTYRVVVEWKSGEISLLELDEGDYNTLVMTML